MARLVVAEADESAGAQALRERTGSERASNIAMRALSGVTRSEASEPALLGAVREMAAARRAHALAARDAALRAAEDRIRAIAAARALEAGAIGLPPIARARKDA